MFSVEHFIQTDSIVLAVCPVYLVTNYFHLLYRIFALFLCEGYPCFLVFMLPHSLYFLRKWANLI